MIAVLPHSPHSPHQLLKVVVEVEGGGSVLVDGSDVEWTAVVEVVEAGVSVLVVLGPAENASPPCKLTGVAFGGDPRKHEEHLEEIWGS